MIPVVYQDEEILVLDKPAGLVTTSSETQTIPSLQDILASDFDIKIERSGIVHRLDKDTSGLLVVAKTKGALETLQAQFKGREVKKEYVALVHGHLDKSGRVEAAILRHPGDREKFTTLDQLKFRSGNENAREAVTEYKPEQLLVMSGELIDRIFTGFNEQSSRAGFHPLTKIQRRKLEAMSYQYFTLLRCFPLTGRTHQIRVHLKYLGFPIVGDDKYGGRRIVRLDRRWVPRQFLHAAHLEFNHPKTGKRMKFDSKLPEDLEKALGFLANSF